MSIESMKQALEALENSKPSDAGGMLDSAEMMANLWHAHYAAIRSLRTAIQQAEAQQPATPEPVYWEWRHLSTHPDTVDFGQWSKWQRVEARSAIHTIDDALAEFRAYIAQGYKYELRALYDHPAPSVPEGYALVPIEPTQAMLNVQTWDFSRFYSPREIWAAMLAAK